MQHALPTHHIRPRAGWINDPNGMTFHEGRWHVFFQHNPAGAFHDRIHWGHVSSADLLTWTEHPVAFGPTPGGPDEFGCWSGVFVPGLERPAVVYSGVVDAGLQSTVCLRWARPAGTGVASDDHEPPTPGAAGPSSDSVIVARPATGDAPVATTMTTPPATFADSIGGASDDHDAPHPGALDAWSDPVVVARTPTGAGVRVMRDPFVFTFGGRRWALLGAGLDDGTPAVLLYSCDDILDWRFEQVWLTHADPVARTGAPADIWECPQLVRVGDVDVLVLALQTDGVLDRAVALTGRLESVDGRPRLRVKDAVELDSGPLFYAPQCLADDGTGDGPLMIGWLRQEGIPGRADDGLVAGCLSLPRRLVESGGRVYSVLDARVADAPGESVQCGPGEVDLPRAARVRVNGDWTLTGADGDLPVSGGPGLIVVDGDVVEVYPDGGTPHADRPGGTVTWRLRTEANFWLTEMAFRT